MSEIIVYTHNNAEMGAARKVRRKMLAAAVVRDAYANGEAACVNIVTIGEAQPSLAAWNAAGITHRSAAEARIAIAACGQNIVGEPASTEECFADIECELQEREVLDVQLADAEWDAAMADARRYIGFAGNKLADIVGTL